MWSRKASRPRKRRRVSPRGKTRTQDAVANDTYDCYYNEDWRLLEERKDGDTDPLNKYIWHPYYVDALLLRWYDADTNGSADAHFYLQDANFNVTAITDVSGAVLERYSYSPYGDVTVWTDVFGAVTGNVTQIGNTHYFTGRERDPETRLQLNRNRFYASHMGRWVNRDPIGYEGSEWNLYEYVSGAPLNFLDPYGLDAGRPIITLPGTDPFDEIECFAQYRSCIHGCKTQFVKCMVKDWFKCEVACFIVCLPAWKFGHWGYGACVAACTAACSLKTIAMDWHICGIDRDRCVANCENRYRRCCQK